MKKNKPGLCLRKVSAAVALALCAMSPAWADEAAKSFADMLKEFRLVPAGKHDSEMLDKASAAIGFIKKMELPAAQQAINEALQLDARNSTLHFLNGFVYHLQAKQGDTQKSELAIEGYRQALRIDPANWIAQEFLGLAYMDLKQFDRARTEFSEVLLMTPDSAVSVQGLMTSAYLTGDASTACAMADAYKKLSTKPSQGFVRSSVPIYASCGNFEEADRMRAKLSAFGGDRIESERVDRRVTQWKAVYQWQEPGTDAAKAGAKQGGIQDGVQDGVQGGIQGGTQNGIKQPPVQLAQAFTLPNQNPGPTRVSETTPTPVVVSVPVAVPGAPGSELRREGPRMVLIDVVLLSTQELISTSKGINLLNALTLQLGSVAGNVAAYSRVMTSTSVDRAPPSLSTAITRAVTIPALSYSLNIANANSSVNEVLARPTLAAIEGMPSEFFSGTNLSAGVVSTSTQGGTTIVPLDKRFGIKLAVTPTFLGAGQVQLKVEAQRTSLNSTADNPKVAYQIEIAEITANANVVMNVGDTLVLSGLSEKATASTRDGVPGLQDVPLVQYLFSNKRTNDIQRSVLILVTPRAPVQVAESARGPGDTAASDMKALREKFGLSATLPTNVEAVMNQLKPGTFFREFRQGDVSMERWDRMRTTGERLQQALEFLYY